MYKPLSQGLSEEESEDDPTNSSQQPLYNDSNYNLSLNGDLELKGKNDSRIMCQNEANQSGLSQRRKFALILSVLNCLAFIILFLWILPCNYDTCQAPSSHLFKLEWETRLIGKFIQHMDIAPSTSNNREVLILIFEESSNQAPTTCPSSHCYGIISHQLLNGKLLWARNWTHPVRFLNCHLLDVNEDGIRDCVLECEDQGLIALDSSKGHILWQYNNSETQEQSTGKIRFSQLMAISDLNKDTVTDLVALGTNSKKLFLFFISGKSGQLLWRHQYNCTHLIDVQMTSFRSLNVTCIEDSVVLDIDHFNSSFVSSLSRNYPTHLELKYTNQGICPVCNATIMILNHLKESVLWSLTSNSTHILSNSQHMFNDSTYLQFAFLDIHFYGEINGTWKKEQRLNVVHLSTSNYDIYQILRYPVESSNISYVLHPGVPNYLVISSYDENQRETILNKSKY